MFAYLNWGVDEIEERVGYGTGAALSNLLGWSPAQQNESS